MDILGTGVDGQVIKAERKTVPFFQGLEVDGYRMPNGEFRVGITTASIVAGFAENYLRRIFAEGSTGLKPLLSNGFSGQTVLQVRVTKTGERQERTITLKDFLRFLRYADRRGKKSAAAILDALSELSLLDFFRDAFGEPALSIDEKRNLFYQAYAATISPEMWRQMDREEILQLALAGDHLYFPQCNDWESIQRWNVKKSSRKKELGHSGLHLNY